MSAALLALLLRFTVVASAAALLLLVLRRPLQRTFGARTAYLFWAIVPLAAVAALLPPPPPSVPTGPLPVLRGVLVAPDAGRIGFDAGTIGLLLVWLAGALGFALRDVYRQHRFVLALGALKRGVDGLWRASGVGGPVVLGAWDARIVLPADFEARFDEEERELILAHERAHVARRDLAANLLGAALRCLQWFNPLAHLAFARFRADQELAADAAVLQRRPDARRRYAEVMLKAQAFPSLSPLGCQWQSAHPLKERILMLKHPLPTLRRAAVGAVAAALLTVGASYAAWATQPRALTEVEQQATYARIVAPKYPKGAADAGLHGNVLLHVLITADGTVEQVEVATSSGHPVLDDAAVATARKWSFNPARNDGAGVASWVGVPISFQLDAPVDDAAPAEPVAGTLDEIYIRKS